MKRLKITILVFIFINCNISLIGQNDFDLIIKNLKKQYSVPKLNKAQMYADFDTLISIVKRCNPQYLIRKEVTGYDMIADMNEQRGLIERCKNAKNFVELLRKTLFLTLDEHCGFGRLVYWFRSDIYANEVSVNKITDKEFGINFHYRDDIFNVYPQEIYFIYDRGKYFLQNRTVLYRKNDSVILPSGTEIISYNNQPINNYLSSIKTIGSRWDFDNNCYYNSTLAVYGKKNSIGFHNNGIYLEFQFTDFIQEEVEWNSSSDEYLIHWFEKDSILYFRIPTMQTINIPELMKMKEYFPEFTIPEWKLNFEKNVLSYRSKPIKSIIIDIRGNEGGNDLAWKELLLGLIIGTPIEYYFCLITCDDNDVFLRYPPDTNKKITFDFAPSYQFCVFEEEIDTIKPSLNNLGYEGTIYLLVDEECYSSALGFASLNTKTERIKTVGMPTGKIGGQGVAASVFLLPHSKFIFTLHLFLDASSVRKTEDFYHNQVTYPVIPSIEYYKYWYNPKRSNIIDAKTMYERDEVFIKALEIIKAEK